MKTKHHVFSAMTALLCAACICLFPIIAAQAYSRINTTRTDLSVTVKCEEYSLNGVTINLYHVADVSKDVNTYTLTSAYSGSSVNLTRSSYTSASDWLTPASTLASYVSANSIAADATGSLTDGSVTFTGLSTGLYLVVPATTKIGSYTYRFTPFLLQLPMLNGDDTWNYGTVSASASESASTSSGTSDATAVLKVSRSGGNDGGGGDSTTYKVVKHWSDTGNESARPASVTVAILRDGSTYRTVTLSDSNDWTASWTTTGDYDWSVSETDVPDGYTVANTSSGTTLIVTNTYTTEIPETGVPETENPGTSSPATSGGVDISEPPVPAAGISLSPSPSVSPSDGTVEIPEEDVPKSELPKTGQLWWPVPILAVAGLLLFSAGWVLTGKSKKKHAD